MMAGQCYCESQIIRYVTGGIWTFLEMEGFKIFYLQFIFSQKETKYTVQQNKGHAFCCCCYCSVFLHRRMEKRNPRILSSQSEETRNWEF